MALLPLDGPSAQLALSVTTVTVQQAKVSTSPLSERKTLTIQPTNGDLYVWFSDEAGTVPTTVVVQTNGLIIYEGSKETYEASDTQLIFILAVNATTNVVVVERA